MLVKMHLSANKSETGKNVILHKISNIVFAYLISSNKSPFYTIIFLMLNCESSVSGRTH